jgi:serine/threonine protein kinase
MQKISEKEISVKITRENHLGNGTLGLVLKTQYHGTEVAAKTLHILSNPVMYGLYPNTPEYELIIKEYEQLVFTHSTLKNPNVVQILGIVYDELQTNVPKWMIQELGETTLEKELQCNPLLRNTNGMNNNNSSTNSNNNFTSCKDNINGLKVKIDILRDILNGLNFIHSKNIPHCSLKPSNIIKVSNTYKLADLGILIFKLSISRLVKHYYNITINNYN